MKCIVIAWNVTSKGGTKGGVLASCLSHNIETNKDQFTTRGNLRLGHRSKHAVHFAVANRQASWKFLP